MKRILLYFVLCSAAMAKSEIYYTKDMVFIVNNKETEYIYNGREFFRCQTYLIWPDVFFRNYICKFWLTGFNLYDFNYYSRTYVPPTDPWIILGISEERYRDWEKTGELHTQEYIDAKKQAAEIKAVVEADRQMATAMMELTNMTYYIDIKTGVWHVDPNCIDNTGTVKISPLDVLKYENRKACEKCTGVK